MRQGSPFGTTVIHCGLNMGPLIGKTNAIGLPIAFQALEIRGDNSLNLMTSNGNLFTTFGIIKKKQKKGETATGAYLTLI